MALYPLPAVYLPHSNHLVRNIEQRNQKMCREQTEFVAACVEAGGARCASIGAVLRIDDVRAASSDNSGLVLADQQSSKVLEVRCTVIGRARIVACENLEVWRDRHKADYLVADVEDYDDEANASAVDDEVVADVVDAMYRLTDALLVTAPAEGAAGVVDVDATVASLEKAASLVEEHRWWEALDLWQMHCATRLAAFAAAHRAERDELVIDAKLRQGGALQLPVQEWTLDPEDRAKLADLDARAADAAAQMDLDDASSFQACLDTRSPAERAALLLSGVGRVRCRRRSSA